MPAEVETMFAIGQKPWHGLGVTLPTDTQLTVDEALKLSGLNWEVGLENIFRGDGSMVKGSKLMTRLDTKAELATVGLRYTPLQNKDAFAWFEPIVESKEVVFETAGSLKDGKIVWVLGRIANNDCMEIKKDDNVCKYILLSHSHDGTQAIRSGFTPIRVVCNNTLSLSQNSASSKLLRIKHTQGAKENLDKVREVMKIANSEFEATAEQYRYLAGKNINAKDLEKYVKVVFNVEDNDKARIINKIIPLFETAPGQKLAGDNYWGAYNAITYFNSHEHGRNADNRLSSVWFGNSANVNERALLVALDLTK